MLSWDSTAVGVDVAQNKQEIGVTPTQLFRRGTVGMKETYRDEGRAQMFGSCSRRMETERTVGVQIEALTIIKGYATDLNRSRKIVRVVNGMVSTSQRQVER